MLVKSIREDDHLSDLQETFNYLRSYNMKLNPNKRVFKVTVGKFLGFMEVQNLNSKVAALNRFVSRVTDKCLPFFCTLKKSFEWMTECQQAFKDLKAYLSSLPLLSSSKPGEELFLYLVVSPASVSMALVREEDGCRNPYSS